MSNLGVLRVLDREIRTRKLGSYVVRPGKIMKPDYANNANHGRVNLSYRGRSERTWIHRIVARAFIGEPPEGKPFVLHWDDDPRNNRVENLRYGNTQDNVDDAIRNGTHPGAVTHCPEGHEYTGANLVRVTGTRRRCRVCENTVARVHYARSVEDGISSEDPRHGSYRGYSAGCRCEPCKLANRAYKTEYGRIWRKRKRENTD